MHTFKSKIIAYIPGLVLAMPLMTHAQLNTGAWIDPMFQEIDALLRSTVPVLLAGGLLLFIWGVIKYFIIGGSDEGARAEGRSYMIYGLIGLTLLVAVWGVVNLLIIMLGFGGGGAPPLPGMP